MEDNQEWKSIKQKLIKFRERLSKDDDSFCFAEIPKGVNENSTFMLDNQSLNPEHIYWLKLCNGSRFGVIDFWPLADLPNQQFYLEPQLLVSCAKEDSILKDYFAQNSLENFYIIAQALYEPVLIHRQTSDIFLPLDYEKPCQKIPLTTFLDEYVLGKSYREFFTTEGEKVDDEWLNFLVKNE